MQRLPNLIERPKDILQIVNWTHILPILFAALILTPLTSPALPAQAKAEKVAICHVDDEGGYKLIHVAAKAVDAHMHHGDAHPGDPGFDENCAEVPILSPGCQAANIPPTTITISTGLVLASITFSAGETITFNVHSISPGGCIVDGFTGWPTSFGNTATAPRSVSYTMTSADVSGPISVYSSYQPQDGGNAVVSISCE